MSSSISNSMSAIIDEENLSSIAQSAPWHQTGSNQSMPTWGPASPKRWDLVFQDAGSSTDGDDIAPTFVNFDSYSSDSEAGQDSDVASLAVALPTCAYSIKMLLCLRAAMSLDDNEPSAVHYVAQAISEIPSTTLPKSKYTSKARTASLSEESWWRAAPSEEDSWWGPPLQQSSAESWVAQQRNHDPEEDESVTRAARSILNKLTVEKFESLFDQLVNCGFTQPHHISILMREVFEKATTQHNFIPMYADLCVKLEKDPRIVSIVEEGGELHNFRRLLLNECQSVFEQLFESSSCELKDCTVDGEAAFRRKQQALGNMKLIGQLLVHGMLSSDLFVGCCEELLRKRVESPEALESLVALMMVAGPKFDKDTWQYYRRLQNTLSDMALLTKDKSVPNRLRFLIRDVLDAREAGWPWSRNGCKTAGIGPSKLKDVKKDAAADASPQCSCVSHKASHNATDAWTPNADLKKAVAAASGNLVKNAPWKKATSPQEDSCNTADASKSTNSTLLASTAAPQQVFQAIEFRRVLNGIFTDLASDKNIPAAVQRIRLQNVPAAAQAAQYVDILTRVVEERRGAVRRCELAFVAGLSAAQSSAFDRKECLAGIDLFFRDVYGGLCNEVHRLPAIMKSEFMPTLLTVLPADDLYKVVPPSMRK